MTRILMVYGTRQGHTGHIAGRMATTMREAGHDVDEFNLARPPAPSPDGYGAVIVGASIHAGKYEPEVREWVSKNREAIDAVPTAFFSVSLAAANHDAESETEVRTELSEFTDETGWYPGWTAKFAGALVYSQYNWLMRRIMRHIVKKKAETDCTDMTHDYDFTDYAEVDAFAREIAHSLPRSMATTPGE